MRKVIDMLDDIGGSYYDHNPDNLCLETIERCVQCKKGFKSRWGRFLSCKHHDGLEEIHMPPIFSTLKKKAYAKRKNVSKKDVRQLPQKLESDPEENE